MYKIYDSILIYTLIQTSGQNIKGSPTVTKLVDVCCHGRTITCLTLPVKYYKYYN